MTFLLLFLTLFLASLSAFRLTLLISELRSFSLTPLASVEVSTRFPIGSLRGFAARIRARSSKSAFIAFVFVKLLVSVVLFQAGYTRLYGCSLDREGSEDRGVVGARRIKKRTEDPKDQ